MSQPECPCDIDSKYVTKHGLACRNCLVEPDFKGYPDWKKSLDIRDRKAEQLDKNLGRTAQV